MENKAKDIQMLSIEETAFFCGQAAMILKSGLPMEDALQAICDESHETGKAAYQALSEAMGQAGSLAEALEIAPVLPEYAIRMIAVGTAAGTLDDVLAGLSDYYLRQQQIRERLRSAITYPVILTMLMGGVIAVLLFKVLPVFSGVLDSMGAGGSRTGEMVTRLGVVLGSIAMGVTALILLGVLGMSLSLRSRRSAAAGRLLMKIGFTKRIVKTMSSERFAAVMAMLMKSGYPMEDGLMLAAGIPWDEESRESILKARELLIEGGSLAESIAKSEMFDPLHIRMLTTAAGAGMMDSMLQKLADIYSERLDRSIRAGEAMVEPALVTLLAIVVGAVLLSVMVPLAGMLAGMI